MHSNFVLPVFTFLALLFRLKIRIFTFSIFLWIFFQIPQLWLLLLFKNFQGCITVYLSMFIWWLSTYGEGGIWTLAPLLTTCTLSRGVPSATWVLLQKVDSKYYLAHQRRRNISNGEGGIRTHAPLRTNGFQDRLVMTTSIPLRINHLFSDMDYNNK